MRILKEDTIAIVIDLQEKLVPLMVNHELLIQQTKILLHGLQSLKIPIITTEQYPKGLGKTIEEIKDILPADSIEKTSFSCLGSPQFEEKINLLNKKNIIIIGIESHICVLQTVIDLISINKTVFVISDCISSRKESEKTIAIERMKSEGAFVSTTESILFELCKTSKDSAFKTISGLIR